MQGSIFKVISPLFIVNVIILVIDINRGRILIPLFFSLSAYTSNSPAVWTGVLICLYLSTAFNWLIHLSVHSQTQWFTHSLTFFYSSSFKKLRKPFYFRGNEIYHEDHDEKKNLHRVKT